MVNEIGFHVVFFVQVWLLSYYFAQKKGETIRYILDNYSEQEYPKLYPQSKAHYERKRTFFLRFTHGAYSLGLILLGMMLYYDFTTAEPIEPLFGGLYFMLQILPYAYLEFSGFFDMSLMRKNNTQRLKRLDLQPRSLFSVVPAWSIALAVSLIIGFIVLVLAINDFELFGDNNVIAAISLILVGNTFLFGLIFWNVYGKKLDPYQGAEDRRKDIRLTVRGILMVSILASLFLILEMTIQHFELDSLRALVMSIYLVTIGYFSVGITLHAHRLEEFDFSVYKADSE